MSNYKDFERRHLGPRPQQLDSMLQKVGASSIEALIGETIPENIRLKAPLSLDKGLTEQEYLDLLRQKAAKNKICRNYIGMGYYPTVVPAVIQRNILENPGWYTAYTPYQAEISQGRLEALLNFQTVISDLTGLPMANASLLDEATACAEAMHMMFNSVPKSKKDAVKFFIADDILPQSLAVCQTKAEGLGIKIVTGNPFEFDFTEDFYGALFQYPSKSGKVVDYSGLISRLKQKDIQTAVAADLMALVLLKSPGDMGADVAVGSSQRFGVPIN